MTDSIQLEIRTEEIIQAVKRMNKKERLAFLEDLFAGTSPEYLDSIREARADYKAGLEKDHSDS